MKKETKKSRLCWGACRPEIAFILMFVPGGTAVAICMAETFSSPFAAVYLLLITPWMLLFQGLENTCQTWPCLRCSTAFLCSSLLRLTTISPSIFCFSNLNLFSQQCNKFQKNRRKQEIYFHLFFMSAVCYLLSFFNDTSSTAKDYLYGLMRRYLIFSIKCPFFKHL